ncbi:MAG: shikimate kinase AroL [Desulfobulbaceae bacterium]|nr:shikimate kinase AroL [Desulfobulbaceae bacterium]
MTAQKRKIILSGYRATGKSTVGRVLAERLDVSFIDMDEVLVARHGEIRDVVKERGWDYFRAREKELLEELVASREAVISTGGGAVLHKDVWRELKKTGLVVWLSADLATICRRLEADSVSDSQRPSLTGSDIKAEAAKVLADREPLYREGAHLMVDATRPVEEVVGEIEKALVNIKV